MVAKFPTLRTSECRPPFRLPGSRFLCRTSVRVGDQGLVCVAMVIDFRHRPREVLQATVFSGVLAQEERVVRHASPEISGLSRIYTGTR